MTLRRYQIVKSDLLYHNLYITSKSKIGCHERSNLPYSEPVSTCEPTVRHDVIGEQPTKCTKPDGEDIDGTSWIVERAGRGVAIHSHGTGHCWACGGQL